MALPWFIEPKEECEIWSLCNFTQPHYIIQGKTHLFLISEAVRGFGAILKTPKGEEFMHKYDKRLSLAPRDIVARAIDNEMKISGEESQLCLDCRHLPQTEFISHFPTIYEKCKSIGIDVFEQMIPVVPAAHYQCGGIDVNENGETSIFNLYACDLSHPDYMEPIDWPATHY